VELQHRSQWRIEVPAGLEQDLATLRQWADTRAAPIDELELDGLVLPRIQALAAQIHQEIASGSGVAWITGVDETDPLMLRLLLVAIGLCIGRPVGAYGRLYDVKDSGRSYIDEPIPVSQTRSSTGVHTDSSNKGICPRFVALLCIQPAVKGGNSRISSALQAHEVLRRDHPRALGQLYRHYMRDLVTPGSIRNRETIQANAFPIFSPPPDPAFRYMRYWIERGHREAGEALTPETLSAFDLLDGALNHPDHVVHFRMERGHMMFCDNTIIAHDRDAYAPSVGPPRWLCHLWLQPEH
jgi:hypothetical protein